MDGTTFKTCGSSLGVPEVSGGLVLRAGEVALLPPPSEADPVAALPCPPPPLSLRPVQEATQAW